MSGPDCIRLLVRARRLYYQHKACRVSVCTINVHGLLHIADGIEFCGPIWCYWAWAMERFCGSLLRIIKSRRYPFKSIDKRVVRLAQLNQIKLSFDLSAELDLSRKHEAVLKGIYIPGCTCTVHSRNVRLHSLRSQVHHTHITPTSPQSTPSRLHCQPYPYPVLHSFTPDSSKHHFSHSQSLRETAALGGRRNDARCRIGTPRPQLTRHVLGQGEISSPTIMFYSSSIT